MLELLQETDPLVRTGALRNAYQRHLACILACSRSLLACDAWNYDTERLEVVASIGEHIQSAAREMQEIRRELGGLERRLGVS